MLDNKEWRLPKTEARGCFSLRAADALLIFRISENRARESMNTNMDGSHEP